MRPTVMHLIDDIKLGGVNLALESLAASRLNQSYHFKLIHRRLYLPSFKRYAADVIVVHGALSWRKIPALLALKLANLNTPILYQEHHYSREFVAHRVAHPKRFYSMLKFGYSLMDRVLLVSTAQASWLEERGILAKEKMVLVGQAKELSRFIALPSRPTVLPLKLLAYGRLSQQKGFDLLIQAMAKLASDSVSLTLAGVGEDESLLSKLAASIPHVRLIGEVQDVPRLLDTIDVVVIPSRWEPFGLTCLEAIAAGKPVVLTALDGLEDQLSQLQEQGEGYYVIDELSVDGIEQALSQVLIDAQNDELIKVNKQQRESCEQGWESMLNNWQRVLGEALEPRASTMFEDQKRR
ncbi:glycosyltransferase family 4 protein [Shewanella sp. Isolate13]|uniref:glycosyltransferase family 4 protein n=1 Tax=Shewanella sp. Isolate13 TaxID=2908531 RepID=UPI001EFE0CCC|nr:glycosyltransferase family 4 protein [Shewanella sp. Isolate13]MCG9728702.1 glycosyltransferase family 4 protein [Shewanella sp. Isolate13]